MNSVSHSDSPEIGIRIVAMGFGLFIYYMWLSLQFFGPRHWTLLFYLLSSSVISQFFFSPSSWILFFYRYLLLVRGESKVGRS